MFWLLTATRGLSRATLLLWFSMVLLVKPIGWSIHWLSPNNCLKQPHKNLIFQFWYKWFLSLMNIKKMLFNRKESKRSHILNDCIECFYWFKICFLQIKGVQLTRLLASSWFNKTFTNKQPLQNVPHICQLLIDKRENHPGHLLDRQHQMICT